MFYDSSLKNGITKALQEKLLVACFVKGSDIESRRWEEDYLADEEVLEALRKVKR